MAQSALAVPGPGLLDSVTFFWRCLLGIFSLILNRRLFTYKSQIIHDSFFGALGISWTVVVSWHCSVFSGDGIDRSIIIACKTLPNGRLLFPTLNKRFDFQVRVICNLLSNFVLIFIPKAFYGWSSVIFHHHTPHPLLLPVPVLPPIHSLTIILRQIRLTHDNNRRKIHGILRKTCWKIVN